MTVGAGTGIIPHVAARNGGAILENDTVKSKSDKNSQILRE